MGYGTVACGQGNGVALNVVVSCLSPLHYSGRNYHRARKQSEATKNESVAREPEHTSCGKKRVNCKSEAQVKS